MCHRKLSRVACIAAFLLAGLPAFSQSDSLALSSGVTTAGGSVLLEFSFYAPSGSQPASLEWTFAFAPSAIVSISAGAGAAAMAADKSLSCTGNSGTYTCFLTGLSSNGLNANIIQNGVIAIVKVEISAAVPSTSINVTNPLGSTPAGGAIQMVTTGGTVSTSTQQSVTSLNCNPSTLTLGASTTCTVRLSEAGSSATTVALSDSNGLLTIPISVTVWPGSTSANFTATAGIFATNQSATVSATLNGTLEATTLSLVQATVSALICTPTSVNSGGAALCTVTLNEIAPSGGINVGVATDDSALSVPSSVTVPAGNAFTTFSAAAGTVTQTEAASVTATLNGSSQSASLSLVPNLLVSTLNCNPSTLNPNTSSICTLTLNLAAPPSGSKVTLSNNSSQLSVPASVSVAAGAVAASFSVTSGTISTGQNVNITATLNNSKQSAGLTLVSELLVAALTCNPLTIVAGSSSTCTVTLNEPAPSGGSIVTLSGNNSVLTMPATLRVPAGATSASFAAAAGTLLADLTVVLTTTLNGVSKTAPLAIASAAGISDLSCKSKSLSPGSASTCTVSLNRAMDQAESVQLSASNTVVTLPSSVPVAPGASSVTFTATAGSVSSSQSATITASLNSTSGTATLNVSPAVVSTLTCNTTSLNAGATSTCTVKLSVPAPAGGVTVAVSSDNPALTVPAALTIPSSSAIGTFPVIAASVATTTGGQSAVNITTTLQGDSRSVPFTVTICPCSLFSATEQPANPDAGVTQSAEVGLAFVSDVSGYITGVRFFKALSNTGTHVGSLWSAAGDLLSTVTFTGETKSGWQLAYFPSPVAVAANTPYVISYNAPNGHYAAEDGFFTSGLSNLPLHTLAEGGSGTNGVYRYGVSGFPATGAAATNFWVDPVFNTSPVIGAVTPLSLWTLGAAPKTAAAPASRAAQLGLTFISDVAGYATGLRFYKSSSNVGPHQGFLWTSTGTLLASVTFTNESASGWQQANFASPVPISAYTPYVISYWAPQGHYAEDARYFATSGFTNQMLYAPPDGQYGPNGILATNRGFPDSSAGASNYWVDVVFSTAIR